MTFGRPRAIFVVDPIDGTRPAAAGLESCCVSVAVVPPREDATLGDVTFGVVHEIKSGDRFSATRGGGARGRARRRSRDPAAAVGQRRSRPRCSGPPGLRGRPVMPVSVVLEELIDGSSMRGGYFDLGSATFNMTRIVTGQLDAYVDIGRRIVDEFPSLRTRVPQRSGRARCARTSPTTSRPPALIVAEAGGVVTHADGAALADHPAVGSGDGYGIAVLASASETLHQVLLSAVDRGMARLGARLAGDEPGYRAAGSVDCPPWFPF